MHKFLRFLRVGLAATGIAAAVAGAGFKAGVAWNNKQLFDEDVALPKKAKNSAIPKVLVQEVVEEVKDKKGAGAVDENHLAKKIESMTRCLTLDKELAQKIAAERVEKAEMMAQEAAAKVAAERPGTTERQRPQGAERARLEAEVMARYRAEDEKIRKAEETAKRRAKLSPEERKREENEELEEYIRYLEYAPFRDDFT